MIKDTTKCIFESCPYDATDHWSETEEELLFVLEEHVRTQHPIPTMELVEGYVTRTAWDTLMEWWVEYRVRPEWCIGLAAGMVLHDLGMNRFLALTE